MSRSRTPPTGEAALNEARERIKELNNEVHKAWDSHKAVEQLYKKAALRADTSEQSYGSIAKEVQALRKEVEAERGLREEAEARARGSPAGRLPNGSPTGSGGAGGADDKGSPKMLRLARAQIADLEDHIMMLQTQLTAVKTASEQSLKAAADRAVEGEQDATGVAHSMAALQTEAAAALEKAKAADDELDKAHREHRVALAAIKAQGPSPAVARPPNKSIIAAQPV